MHSLILLPHSNTLQEPFFWNIEKCYEGYPHNVSLSYTILYYNVTVVISVLSTLQPPSSLVLAYWALQLAFYSSLIVSVFRDVRRKVSTVCVHVKHVDMLRLLAGLPGSAATPRGHASPAAALLCHQHGEDGSPHCAGARCQ